MKMKKKLPNNIITASTLILVIPAAAHDATNRTISIIYSDILYIVLCLALARTIKTNVLVQGKNYNKY